MTRSFPVQVVSARYIQNGARVASYRQQCASYSVSWSCTCTYNCVVRRAGRRAVFCWGGHTKDGFGISKRAG